MTETAGTETEVVVEEIVETVEPVEAAAPAPREEIVIERPIQTVGRRKEAVVRVRLVPGTGKFDLDGRSLEAYFPNKVHQQLIKAPLVIVDRVEAFDIFAHLHGGGPSGQAGALRLAISRALILDTPEDRPALKKAGFLTRDPRAVERKKYGLEKARKAPQNSKPRSRRRLRPRTGWVALRTILLSCVCAVANCERLFRMGRLFGTDGVRGVANRELTAELALALGAAAARRLTASGRGRRRVAVIGRDPRASGEMLEAAVIAGLTSEGVDALRAGVLPTPAVAYLTSAYDADFGVMISASHNPMPDNGIKIFGPGGHKLDDATEDQIEDLVATGPGLRPAGSGIGRVIDAEDALDRYLRHVGKAGTVGLNGLTVVVDCAHGAASVAAPRAYRAAGARVIAINAEPNGLNINDRC